MLKAGEPIAFEVPELTVDSLPVGTHQIRLVVQDDSGQTSEPFFADITVTPLVRTGPVIDTGPVITGPVVDPGPVRTGPVITRGPVVTPTRIVTPSPITPSRSLRVRHSESDQSDHPGKDSPGASEGGQEDAGQAQAGAKEEGQLTWVLPKTNYRSRALRRIACIYATGTLLDARDFLDEQTYHRGRLARAMQYLHGSGTVSGLHVEYKSPIAPGTDPQFPRGRDEEIFINPGVAVDRLGRMIEVPAAACIRLVKWFEGQQDAPLRLANHGDPFGGVVVDLFVRFSPCERGMTPAFASGPYDAIDAVAASRVRDAYTLELVLRTEHAAAPDPDIPPLPKDPWPDVSAMNPAERRLAVRNAVFQSWREGSDSWNENGPNRFRNSRTARSAVAVSGAHHHPNHCRIGGCRQTGARSCEACGC